MSQSIKVPIPLSADRVAFVDVPIPITQADVDKIRRVLESMVEDVKPKEIKR